MIELGIDYFDNRDTPFAIFVHRHPLTFGGFLQRAFRQPYLVELCKGIISRLNFQTNLVLYFLLGVLGCVYLITAGMPGIFSFTPFVKWNTDFGINGIIRIKIGREVIAR